MRIFVSEKGHVTKQGSKEASDVKQHHQSIKRRHMPENALDKSLKKARVSKSNKDSSHSTAYVEAIQTSGSAESSVLEGKCSYNKNH